MRLSCTLLPWLTILGSEKQDTRLTPQELELVLTRWRDEKEGTVSVADVAEALHCSKAEIEALVWKARAEGVHDSRVRQSSISVRGCMIVILGVSGATVLGSCLLPPTAVLRYNLLLLSALSFLSWIVYASVCVLSGVKIRRD